MAKNSDIILNLPKKNSPKIYHILDIYIDYPEESYFRKLMEIFIYGNGDIEGIRKGLKSSEIAKKFSDDINKAGNEFWNWLIEFNKSEGNTFGFFDS
jgi:hypothetical protein